VDKDDAQLAQPEPEGIRGDNLAFQVVKGFLGPQGTQVSVIGSGGFAKRKIVITNGEMTGRTGFVPMEWVVAR
jgi:hypothetical protein